MFNAQSVLAHMDEITDFVSRYDPPVLVLTETHLTEMVDDLEIAIEGYDVIRVDSSSRHTGGVCVYIKHGVKYNKVDEYVSHKNYWVLVVKVTIKKWTATLAGFYRSPSGSQANFLEYFSKFCEEYSTLSGSVMVMGDFNINWESDNIYPRQLQTCVRDNNLKQIVNDVTHITGNSRTTIDLVFTNDDTLHTKIFDNSGISCHRAVMIRKETPGVEKRKIAIRRRVVDERTYAQRVGAVRVDVSADLNNKVSSFVRAITDIIDECSPKVEIVVNNNRNAWFNETVKNAVKRRNQAYSRFIYTDAVGDWKEYKRARNDAVQIIETEKRRYFERKIDDNKKNSTLLWKTLKTLIKSKGRDSCPQVKVGSKIFDDPCEIAEKFNEFFIESITEITSGIGDGNGGNSESTPITVTGYWQNFDLPDLQMLKKIVFNMDNKGSPDDINVKFLKEHFQEIGETVLQLLNESLMNGEVPDVLKVSTVVPVRKVPKSVSVEDFRPINMLPALEKILERAVYNQLLNFVQQNEVLTDYQSGFRKNYSCETAFQVVLNDWKEALNSGEIVLAVFLDLKRAFETIDRQKLLKKLQNYGVGGTVLRWFRSYLTNRVQRVRFGDVVSSEKSVDIGVPQGSILGPLLFILYINDLALEIKSCKFHFFADDTIVYLSKKELPSLVELVNEELKGIGNWLASNKLKLNVKKTKCMLLGKETKHQEWMSAGYSVEIENEQIDLVNTMKYLGIVVDRKLNFSDHVDYMCKKIAKKLGVLGRLSKFISMYSRKLVYNAIVLPHFYYCGTILSMINCTGISRLQKLQNKGMRHILQCDRFSHSADMLTRLEWLSVRQLGKYFGLTFVHRMRLGQMPRYFDTLLQKCDSIHNYHTRNSENYYVRTKRLKVAHESVFVRGIIEYNDLPTQLKCLSSTLLFKRNLRLYLLSNR